MASTQSVCLALFLKNMPMAARLSNRQYPNADNSSIEKLKTIYFNSTEGAFTQVKQLHQNESNVINKKETN